MLSPNSAILVGSVGFQKEYGGEGTRRVHTEADGYSCCLNMDITLRPSSKAVQP